VADEIASHVSARVDGTLVCFIPCTGG
jgi:hypothetical protein